MREDFKKYYLLVYSWDEESGRLLEHNNIPKMGVYCLVCGKHSYVGSSDNLYRRLKEHINTIFSHGVNGSALIRDLFKEERHLEIYVLSEETNRERLIIREEEYIRILKPDCNISVARAMYKNMSLSVHPRFFEKIRLFMATGAITLEEFEKIPKIGKGVVLEIMFDEFVENHKDELEDYLLMYKQRSVGEIDW